MPGVDGLEATAASAGCPLGHRPRELNRRPGAAVAWSRIPIAQKPRRYRTLRCGINLSLDVKLFRRNVIKYIQLLGGISL